LSSRYVPVELLGTLMTIVKLRSWHPWLNAAFVADGRAKLIVVNLPVGTPVSSV
jgi:hypothetical protein